MKTLLTLMTAATIAVSGAAFAHGDQPKHGGVMSSANDVSFELVDKDGRAMIYVEDHGKPVATAGASGKLTVLSGGKKAELPLEPAGENSLAAKGDAKLGKGAKAVAAVTFADKRTINVRFAIK